MHNADSRTTAGLDGLTWGERLPAMLKGVALAIGFMMIMIGTYTTLDALLSMAKGFCK